MAIDDNTVYGLTGAQVKELPEKIEAVKGLARELTAADYNYPTDNPDRVSLCDLPAGLYCWDAGFRVYLARGYKVIDTTYAGNAYVGSIDPTNGGERGIIVYDNPLVNGGAITKYSATHVTSGSVGYNRYGSLLSNNSNELFNGLGKSLSGQAALDAKQGKVLKDLIDSIAIRGAGAPTTSTVGEVGQLYEDGTNGALYQLKSIDITVTPNTYNWEEIGGAGGGITELTTEDYNYDEGDTGTNNCIALWLLDEGNYRISDSSVKLKRRSSTTARTFASNLLPVGILIWGENNSLKNYIILDTSNEFVKGAVKANGDNWTHEINMIPPVVVQGAGNGSSTVMSQNATTSMVFADPSTRHKIRIGNNAYNNGTCGVSIGEEAGISIAGDYAVAIGPFAKADANGAIALGRGAHAINAGEMNIGSSNTIYGYNNSNYRLLTGLYDPQSAHDAATKGYVDTQVGNINTALQTLLNGTGA